MLCDAQLARVMLQSGGRKSLRGCRTRISHIKGGLSHINEGGLSSKLWDATAEVGLVFEWKGHLLVNYQRHLEWKGSNGFLCDAADDTSGRVREWNAHSL